MIVVNAKKNSAAATKPALQALRDYEQQKRQGLDPVFDPDRVGIRNADLWRKAS